MKTPSEVPGPSFAQGKPITTVSAAWLPVNNMTHKLIMPLSLLPPFPSLLPLARSHSITPVTATPPVWCPARFQSAGSLVPMRLALEWQWGWADVSSAFWSVCGGGGVDFWEKWDTCHCPELTSEPPQHCTFFPGAGCQCHARCLVEKKQHLLLCAGATWLHHDWWRTEERGESGGAKKTLHKLLEHSRCFVGGKYGLQNAWELWYHQTDKWTMSKSWLLVQLWGLRSIALGTQAVA